MLFFLGNLSLVNRRSVIEFGKNFSLPSIQTGTTVALVFATSRATPFLKTLIFLRFLLRKKTVPRQVLPPSGKIIITLPWSMAFLIRKNEIASARLFPLSTGIRNGLSQNQYHES